MIPIAVEDLGPTRDGGSCAECDQFYRGAPYQDRRGRRILAEIEPGLVEPVNLCPDCVPDSYQEVDVR